MNNILSSKIISCFFSPLSLALDNYRGSRPLLKAPLALPFIPRSAATLVTVGGSLPRRLRMPSGWAAFATALVDLLL